MRELYERKLERTNNLYLELSAVLLQVEQREQELSKREQQLRAAEKTDYRHQFNKKKLRPIFNKGGKIQKKYEISWRTKSPDIYSTSPESPVHGAAAFPRSIPMVRANPMYDHIERNAERRLDDGDEHDSNFSSALGVSAGACTRVRALGAPTSRNTFFQVV